MVGYSLHWVDYFLAEDIVHFWLCQTTTLSLWWSKQFKGQVTSRLSGSWSMPLEALSVVSSHKNWNITRAWLTMYENEMMHVILPIVEM